MTSKKTFLDIMKKNIIIHKTMRKVYDNIKFRNSIINKNLFEKRIEKKRDFVKKNFDFSQKNDKNIIIVTIDCLRNDHVSYNKYFRKTTPFLDSINGSKFTMISSAPWTYPSVTSLLTGFYPHNHGAIINETVNKFEMSKLKPINGNIITLSEILTLVGYNTYLHSGIDLAYLPLRNRFHNFNLTSLANGIKIIDDFKKWSKRQKGNFFSYIHLMDLHEPIKPPKPFNSYFGNVKKLPNIRTWDFKNFINQTGKAFDEFKDNKILLYDNALKYVDYLIEYFYTFMEKEGLLDSTILIITADHGEEFWDHAELEAKNFYDVRGNAGVGHGHNVFNELIQIPLIIFNSQLSNHKVENNLISNVDVTPTLLNMLDISYHIKFDGLNFLKSSSERMLLSENTIHGYEKKALIYKNFKFLTSKSDGIAWVFNLKNDPNEKNPISDEKLTSIFNEKLEKATEKKLLIGIV